MSGDGLSHEAAVDGFATLSGGGDECVKGELVDETRLALAGVEDLGAGPLCQGSCRVA